MASWLSTDTKVVVQGLTGREGKFHALAGRDQLLRQCDVVDVQNAIHTQCTEQEASEVLVALL